MTEEDESGQRTIANNILLTTGNNNKLLNLLRSKIVLGHTKLVSEVDEYLKSIGCAECKYKE
ncbi:hypothetical protein E2562_034831 [Oryza meyeriana var. granulata]|uniref:Uncharacterized protein n=1 Tax=Oryza meyeriana var. granulata TaxID=110450 RepID=A0A6G1E6H1_9ORYZ|nr:hypothetical protein E2562_034831 [Oryza meyeriana var. granulata]